MCVCLYFFLVLLINGYIHNVFHLQPLFDLSIHLHFITFSGCSISSFIHGTIFKFKGVVFNRPKLGGSSLLKVHCDQQSTLTISLEQVLIGLQRSHKPPNHFEVITFTINTYCWQREHGQVCMVFFNALMVGNDYKSY